MKIMLHLKTQLKLLKLVWYNTHKIGDGNELRIIAKYCSFHYKFRLFTLYVGRVLQPRVLLAEVDQSNRCQSAEATTFPLYAVRMNLLQSSLFYKFLEKPFESGLCC